MANGARANAAQQQQKVENQQTQTKLSDEHQAQQAQVANALVQHQILVHNLDKMSEPLQQQLNEQEAVGAEEQDTKFGNPPESTYDNTSDAYKRASELNTTAANGGDHFSRYTVLHRADGKAGVYKMTDQTNNEDLPITLADGSKVTVPAHSMSGATYFATRVAIANSNMNNDFKQQAQDLKQQLADEKNKQKAPDTESMIKTGIDKNTGQRLTLDNAPDEAMVDLRTGNPIPTSMNSTLRPDIQEKNRADFANSTLHTLDRLEDLRQQGKLPNGPMTGITKQQLAKAGLGDADAQDAINSISLMQSSATGAHVGGRFSVPVLQKMQGLLSLNMNTDQWRGAVDSIRSVMQPYKDNGRTTTVAEYRQMEPEERQRLKASTGGPTQPKSNPDAVNALIKKHSGGQ
jgi:hypothetical protein